ncbi:tRNA-dihydrouridine synthase [Candidatus Woesearchaeota archaeon]|nr:tRNA-dihydrouridine synthase [Candidatus Woesearchaeota archaeon]
MVSYKIGNLKFEGRVFLAPLAAVNDLAFREMSTKYGSALNFTEMVNVNAVERMNKSTLKMADTFKDEKVFIQLFGTRLDAIKNTIRILEKEYDDCTPSGFDFNLGCPVKKVMDQGAGSALLKRPKKIGEIVSTMRSSTDLPITAKMRLGLSPNTADHIKIARLIAENGADAIAVHARYQSQGYSGKAHWDKIKEIVEAVDIPVIGNGDVVDEDSCKNMFDISGCAFAMVGRGVMGNPFLFTRLNSFLQDGKRLEQKDKIEMFLEYLQITTKYDVKFSYIKTHAMWFTKGINGGASIREKISLAENVSDLLAIFKNHQKS